MSWRPVVEVVAHNGPFLFRPRTKSMKKKKITGYTNYIFGDNFVADMSVRRIAENMYEWVYYTCRGEITFLDGCPVGSSRIEDNWPAGKRRKVHATLHRGTAKEFDNFVMEKLSNIFEDVEPGMVALSVSRFPIIGK